MEQMHAATPDALDAVFAALADPTPEAYGAALRDLLVSPERREALAAAALETVRTTYSLDRFKETVGELLQALARNQASPE